MFGSQRFWRGGGLPRREGWIAAHAPVFFHRIKRFRNARSKHVQEITKHPLEKCRRDCRNSSRFCFHSSHGSGSALSGDGSHGGAAGTSKRLRFRRWRRWRRRWSKCEYQSRLGRLVELGLGLGVGRSGVVWRPGLRLVGCECLEWLEELVGWRKQPCVERKCERNHQPRFGRYFSR